MTKQKSKNLSGIRKMVILMGSIKKNWRLILEGIRNYLRRNKSVESVAAYRMAICKMCVYGTGRTCEVCGCVLDFKVRAMGASCAMDHIGKKKKWDKVDIKND